MRLMVGASEVYVRCRTLDLQLRGASAAHILRSIMLRQAPARPRTRRWCSCRALRCQSAALCCASKPFSQTWLLDMQHGGTCMTSRSDAAAKPECCQFPAFCTALTAGDGTFKHKPKAPPRPQRNNLSLLIRCGMHPEAQQD